MLKENQWSFSKEIIGTISDEIPNLSKRTLKIFQRNSQRNLTWKIGEISDFFIEFLKKYVKG